MAIEIRATRVVSAATTGVSVAAVCATATSSARAPTLNASAPPGIPQPFHLYQEYFGDGGGTATQHNADLEIESASFRAILSSGEITFWNAHHGITPYTCLPHNLLCPAGDGFLQTNYPDSTDNNIVTTMTNLKNSYGFGAAFWFMGPEWDNDPANQGWAANRFTEAGVTGSRQDLPSGLTRQQAYDQWIHFYTATNHGGNTNHHQLGQIFGAGDVARGYKVMCNNTQAGSCHYSFEMGMDLVTLQRNEDELSGMIGGIALIRGAAKQYSKQWGIDISQVRGHFRNGVLLYSGSTLVQGWTNATYKRHRHLAYMCGADVIAEEAVDWSGTTDVINGRSYNPGAAELKRFCNFAFTRHPYQHRGVPHVPVAIMKDHISMWEPRHGPYNQGRNVWWAQMGANAGENMLHNLWDMIYPNYNDWGTSFAAPEPMGSGRFGEQFDMLTERASAAAMSNYRVVMLSTNAVMDATLQAKFNTFVAAGGILIINAKQLSGTAHQSLTGITLTGTSSAVGALTFELDGTSTTEPTFNYSTVTLGTATRIARTGASTPQITRNLVGSGQVWTVLPDYMSNPGNTATLGVAAKIVDYWINQFAVGTISGGSHTNIQYTVTKGGGASGAANTVTIINTNDPGGATWTGTVALPQGSPVREWVNDTTPSSSNTGGRTNITASVPPGDVRVYAVG